MNFWIDKLPQIPHYILAMQQTRLFPNTRFWKFFNLIKHNFHIYWNHLQATCKIRWHKLMLCPSYLGGPLTRQQWLKVSKGHGNKPLWRWFQEHHLLNCTWATTYMEFPQETSPGSKPTYCDWVAHYLGLDSGCSPPGSLCRRSFS